MVLSDTSENVPVRYEIVQWRESTFDGHSLGHTFKGRVWSDTDSLLAFRYIGKQFVLEMKPGQRISLFITDQSGAVEHCPGPVEGFPIVKN